MSSSVRYRVADEAAVGTPSRPVEMGWVGDLPAPTAPTPSVLNTSSLESKLDAGEMQPFGEKLEPTGEASVAQYAGKDGEAAMMTAAGKTDWRKELADLPEHVQQAYLRRKRRLRCFRKSTSVFNVVYSVALLAVFIWYMVTLVQNYTFDQQQPASSVAFVPQTQLRMPAMVFCNWLMNGTAPVVHSCLMYTTNSGGNVTASSACGYGVVHLPRTNNTADGTRECLVVNNRTDSTALNATGAGFVNRLELLLEMSEEMLAVTFFKPGGTPDVAALDSAAMYMQPGMSLVALRQRHRIFVSGAEEEDWSTAMAVVNGQNMTAIFGSLSGVTDLTMLLHADLFYESMSVETIRQQPSTTVAALLGSGAGMLGVLLGLNAVNVLFAVEGVIMRSIYQK